MENRPKNTHITINVNPVSGAAPDGVSSISAAHQAGVTVNINTADNQNHAPNHPASALSTNQFFQTKDQQMASVQKQWIIHESLDDHLKEGLAPHLAHNDPSIMVKIAQVAHQVMSELLRGNMALRVDPSDLMHLFDTIRDQALLYVNGLNQGDNFCPATLKSKIMNHPAVQDFKEMHDPRHGHNSTMRAHPKTGMPSKTVLASHIGHHDTVEEHQHGAYIGGHNHD